MKSHKTPMKSAPLQMGGQARSSSRLVRKGPSPMVLEQRFMFDGAAVDTAVAATKPVADLLHFTTDTALPQALVTAQVEAEKMVSDFLSQSDARTKLFALFNGSQTAPSAQWNAAFDQLMANLQNGGDAVRVELRSSVELQGAKGAFSATGTTGQFTIYLNTDWLAGNATAGIGAADSASIETVLAEELGHSLDARLNGSADTAGDEGQHFSDVLLNGADPYAADAAAMQDDYGVLQIDGQAVEAEFASYTFVNAYQMVTDVNNDGIVQNTENWAAKEQSTHTLLVAGNGTDANFGGLGQVSINDDTNSAQFSGNDVSAIGINIGGSNYYGWISRPVKVGGQVVGFYFWTDHDFTNLASAQTDGNQDSDTANAPSSPGVTDNKGFILVVNQSYFNGLIAAHGTTTVTGTPQVWGGVAAGTYNTIEVGSSSDRVDSALNALLPAPVTPSATPDTATGTPSTAGGAALEQGSDGNSPSLNTQVSAGVLTAGVNATGNVLTNDTPNSGLTVSKISSSTGNSANVTSSVAGVVVGKFGTLTQNGNGSYTYVVDNSNQTVDALSAGGTLNDVFTYTAIDGKGGSVSTTLTVQINGSNDAPVAHNDYNTAKEITTTSNTGYTATGNVLPNDSDVDTGDTKSVIGSSISGSATANVAVTAGTYSLTFTGTLGFSTGNAVFVELGQVAPGTNGTVYTGLYTRSGSNYTLVTVTKNSSTGTLNATPTYYYDPTSNTFVAITNLPAFFTTYKYLAFANYTDSNLATGDTLTETNSTKTQTVSSTSGSGYTTLSGLSLQSGTIAIGMTVTGTGVPTGTTVTDVTLTSGVVTSIVLGSDQITSTNGTAFTFTGASGLATTLTGQHGTLVLQANGSYVYTPFTDNTKLSSGDVATEIFDYTMRDTAGATSAAKLYITVYGSGSNDPVVATDSVSVYESGVGRTPDTPATSTVDPNAVFQGENIAATATTGTTSVTKTITYNVLGNDTPGAGGVVNSYTLADGTGSTGAGANLIGTYGTLSIASNGAVTYSVLNSNSAVQALLPGSTLTETFRYKVTNTALGVNWSTLTITINGTNDAPVAVNDTVTANAGQAAATGNVLSNDTDVDSGDTKTVTLAQSGTTATPSTAVPASSTSTSGSPLQITGTYGTLTLGADGTYSYAIDPTNTTVKALAAGVTTSETFSYQMKDSNGATSVATLTVTVTGQNEAPVNTYPTTVTGAINTSFNFTGVSNTISVADVDGNLSEVVLHVDHGALSASTSGGGSISGTGGDLIITGTQAQINAILATLSYTPTSNFTGSDYLTIYSKDSNSAYDSDGIAINIPTPFTGPTVKESDLTTGSTPSGTGEIGSATLTPPNGQTFGSTIQTGTDTYGTWTLNGGTFTYTLTSAPQVSGASSTTTVYITTYDQFGNATLNPVTVTINDDAPVAAVDTNTAVDGGAQVTGSSVLTNDKLGADGPATTTPAGGVIGVRAAAADTTTEVTTGVGTNIAGLYGSLTLNANGSYTYTPGSHSLASAADDVFVYTIQDADGDRSTTTLTITVQAAGTASADLSIAKSVSTSNLNTTDLSGYVVYTLTVSNAGTSSATGVSIHDALPTGLTFLAASTDGSTWDSTGNAGVYAGGYTLSSGNWSISDIASNGSTTVYIKAQVTQTGSITNQASVSSSTYDPNLGNNSDTGTDGNQTVNVSSADLSIAKSVNNQHPTLNGEVIYTLTVTNNGNDTAANVRVTDDLPAGLTLVAVSTDGGSTWVSATTAGYTTVSGHQVWAAGDITNGSSKSLLIKATVTSTSAINNVGRVTSNTYDPNTVNNIDDGSNDNGGNNQRVDAFSPITVTGGTYNENSARALFTVHANLDQWLTFDVRDVAAPGKAPTGHNEGKPNDSLDTAPIYYSLDGGTTWNLYTGAPVQAGAVPVLVAVDIANERDDFFEGEEQFQLVVNPGQPTQASDFSSIFDDGTGDIIDESGHTNPTARKDDDRPVPQAPPPAAPPPAPIPAPLSPVTEVPKAPLPPFDSATTMAVRSPAPPLEVGTLPVEAILTSDSGFPVKVAEPGNATLAPSLTLANAVTDQFGQIGSESHFALPYDTFAHTKPDAQITLTARQQDGTDLPKWVSFDPQSGTFTIVPPADLPANQRELRLMVIARDQEGREAVAPFRTFIGEGKGKVSGRPSLSEQLKLATKRADTPWAAWSRQPVAAKTVERSASVERVRAVAHAG